MESSFFRYGRMHGYICNSWVYIVIDWISHHNTQCTQLMYNFSTSRYLSQCWPWYMLPYGFTGPHKVNQYLNSLEISCKLKLHDNVIKWKHFPRYWPFVRGIHRSPMNSPHKGWINVWVNNREVGNLRCHPAHYDFTVMMSCNGKTSNWMTFVSQSTKLCLRLCTN